MQSDATPDPRLQDEADVVLAQVADGGGGEGDGELYAEQDANYADPDDMLNMFEGDSEVRHCFLGGFWGGFGGGFLGRDLSRSSSITLSISLPPSLLPYLVPMLNGSCLVLVIRWYALFTGAHPFRRTSRSPGCWR